uniref:GAF domain-containing protein n=1 Tax=Bicosoecida sp. CB-2014 TaxID=1486930 RepID=A0A7S1C5Y3_9STRA
MAADSEKFSEGAADYLGKTNFKSLVEWLTAEVLFHRPDDPLAFVREVVGDKLSKRGGAPYDSRECDRYLQECYEDPSVDTDSAMAGRKEAEAELPEDAMNRLKVLEKLIVASRSIAKTLDPFAATSNIISETCNLLEADRATLFKLDPARGALKLMVAEGAEDIYLPLGTGIAGTVAETGTPINISDAYSDARFDRSHDDKTGYRTKSILCVPVRDAEDNVVGCIQAINSASGEFSEIDEEILGILCAQAGVALRNADLYTLAVKSHEKVRGLLEVIRAMHDNLGINSLMFTITQRAHTIVDADRCTFFLANHASKELWAMQGEVDIRIPMDKGIAGAVATSGEMINIHDAYEDSRFNQEVDRASGYRTRTILCMPLRGTDAKVVGVIQLINKRFGVFDAEDEEIMEVFLNIAGPIIENSQLFQASASKADESGTEFTGKTVARTASASSAGFASSAVIEEGDEDEEEDD